MVRAGGVLMQKLRRLGLVILLLGAVALGGCFLFPNHPPIASITVTYSSEDPLVVDLDASGSTDEDGDEIVAYMWSFGEDDVEIITPLTSSATVTEELHHRRFPVCGCVRRDPGGEGRQRDALHATHDRDHGPAP